MKDLIFNDKFAHAYKLWDGMNSKADNTSCFRVYRTSPGCLQVQVRCNYTPSITSKAKPKFIYSTASISKNDVIKLITELTNELENL